MFNAKNFKTMKRNYIKPETEFRMPLLSINLMTPSIPTETDDDEDDGWAEGGQNVKGRYGDLWDDSEVEDFYVMEED